MWSRSRVLRTPGRSRSYLYGLNVGARSRNYLNKNRNDKTMPISRNKRRKEDWLLARSIYIFV